MEAVQAYPHQNKNSNHCTRLQPTSAVTDISPVAYFNFSKHICNSKCKNYHTINESDLDDSALFMYVLPLKNSNTFIYDDLKVKTFSFFTKRLNLLDLCLTG